MNVRKRQVFYIPGYDPNPPRTYRERYRRESGLQAKHSGYEISQTRLEGVPHGWQVEALVEGAEVTAKIEVLYWADIVRASMQSGVIGTYWSLFRTAWIYIGSGVLFRLMRLRKGPVIAALYPVFVLLLQLLLAAALGFGVSILALGLSERFLDAINGPAFLLQPYFGERAWFCFLVFAPLAAWLFLRWCARKDHLLAWYLMKDYAFSARLRGAYPPEQESRMDKFRQEITNALKGDADEVLVVGHSSGAYIAVSVLADILRNEEDVSKLSLLTLGHVVPMVSFLPKAQRLRSDLSLMAAADVPWVDVSAPGDGCSFALCDPVAVTGVAPPEKSWPLVISAAFSQTLSEKMQRSLKWRLFERHFQYLNAFDQLPDSVDAYDYFRVTAGPLRLADRFEHRLPSNSRIETPTSGFTDIEP